MKIIAHRGNVSQSSENTLAAIKQAIDSTFDGVEFDVRCTKDGVVILMHDATINRTTNSKGRVSQMTYTEMESVRTKDNLPVPTLSSVMTALKPATKKIINIEIKSRGCLAEVAKYATWPNVYISSPLKSEIETLKQLVPGGQYGLVVSNPLSLMALAKHSSYKFLTVHKILINQAVMKFLRSHKQEVWIHTIKSRAEVKRAASLGANAIFVDL